MQTHTLSSAVAIRRATRADLSDIEALLSKSGLPLDGVREELCEFLVAEAGSRIVGVVGMEYCGRYGLLRSTAVEPAWRSHGVGRALVERIIAEAESRGIHALYLLTTTAERYFPTFGFRTTARETVPDEIRATDEFRSACPESATVMHRSMPAA
jgi:N-acetylglutamate synthase-like GNAT family acetyltransferase